MLLSVGRNMVRLGILGFLVAFSPGIMRAIVPPTEVGNDNPASGTITDYAFDTIQSITVYKNDIVEVSAFLLGAGGGLLSIQTSKQGKEEEKRNISSSDKIVNWLDKFEHRLTLLEQSQLQKIENESDKNTSRISASAQKEVNIDNVNKEEDILDRESSEVSVADITERLLALEAAMQEEEEEEEEKNNQDEDNARDNMQNATDSNNRTDTQGNISED